MAISVIGLSALFFLGHAFRLLFIRTKIPDLLFLVLVGYLLGPVFGVLAAESLGKFGGFLTTVALVVILYEGGLELKTKQLLESGTQALALGLFNFGFAAGGTYLVAHYGFGVGEIPSMLLGIALGCTSSAVVMPLVRILSISNRARTILSLESAITDVLSIVTFIVLLDVLEEGTFEPTQILIGIGPETLKAILLGMFCGFVWAVLRKRLPKLTSVSFAGEAWALFCYGLIELIHLNGVMAVLSLGFMLSNLNLLPEWAKILCIRRPVGAEDLGLLQELSQLLRTFFFVYLGLMLDFSHLNVVALAGCCCLLIFIFRLLSVRFFLSVKKFSKMDAAITSAMGPRGLASAVLASLALQRGLPEGPWLREAIFAAIPLSIIMTAVLVAATENWNLNTKFTWFYGKYRAR